MNYELYTVKVGGLITSMAHQTESQLPKKNTLSTHLWSVAGKMLLEQILFAWLLSPLETNLFMVNK